MYGKRRKEKEKRRKEKKRKEKKRKERGERQWCGAGQDKVWCSEVRWVWGCGCGDVGVGGCYMLNVLSNSVGLHLVLQAFA